MGSAKRLSIIIVNWKVRELLRECLLSLFRNTALPKEQYEVVVVDNDSGDGSVAMIHAEFPEVTAIANSENVGFGAANNQAMHYCSGTSILLLNPDTVVLPGAVDCMLKIMETSPQIAILGCRLQNGDGSLQRWTGGAFPTIWNLASHYFFIDRLLPSALRPPPLYLDHDATQDASVGWVSGACMLLRRAAVGEQIFNPLFFMYGEDMELCHRVRLAGHEVAYTPAATIIHYQGESIRQQKGDIMLSSLKGPRQFYLMTHGHNGIFLFDWVTLCGFFLRWLIFSMGAVMGRAGMRERARSSWHYTEIIRRLMLTDAKKSSGT